MPQKTDTTNKTIRWLSQFLILQAASPAARALLGAAAIRSHTLHTQQTRQNKPTRLDKLRLATLAKSAKLARLYGWGSGLVLIVTTCWWSTLGALTNLQNADQLVNGYLFESARTFERASFPAQHSFLLKWPLFVVTKWLGLSSGAFIASTIAVCLATVVLLMWLIRRLEKRPLYYGTLFLALASCLLLVPTAPYPGGLLPVSMAMSTTRNLEYMVFVGLLAYAVNIRSLRSRHFWAVTFGAILLFASDRLFVVIALGGALFGFLAFLATKHYYATRLQTTWFGMAIGSSIAAKALLALIGAFGLTHFVATADSGPYQLVSNIHSLLIGTFYSVAGIFTNLGANPAFDATTLAGTLTSAVHHLFSPAGPAYLANMAIVVVGIFALYQIARRAYRNAPPKAGSLRQAITNAPEAFISRGDRLVLALAWLAVAASLAFIATNHQYVVDARYLGIWLFCLFVALAAFSPSLHFRSRQVAMTGAILSLAVVGGIWGANHNFMADNKALQDIAKRNLTVVQALQARHTSLLVGDYWRAIPIRQLDRHRLIVTPLETCTRPRQVLSSKAWQPDLANHGFAYLLSTDRGLTDFPACELRDVISEFGRPSGSLVIAGNIQQPRELLLFYDHGINRASHRFDSLSRSAIAGLPTLMNKLSPGRSICGEHPTIMNFVAHQDDDILFMNPDISHDISADNCVRTIYLTAGDAGNSQPYWIGRERGSESAYGDLLGSSKTAWTEQIVNLADASSTSPDEYVTIASPLHNPRVSLIFMHLPDGGLHGQGFASSHHQSLAELDAGSLSHMQSVDHQSEYTKDSLVQALTGLMQLYKPNEVRTQAGIDGAQFSDHSDHRTVGSLVANAYQHYANPNTSLAYYVGYPVREQPANLSGNDLNQKLSAFLSYAQYDGSVCHDQASCEATPTYGDYLQRQYRYTPDTGEITGAPIIPIPAL